jgi:zinc protease
MLLASLAALTLSAAPPAPFTAGPSIEGVSEYRLPNGLRVLLVPDVSKPTVTVNLTVFVGSRNENYGEKGMAHLFEHMLFKRTKKLASIKDELTKLGGMANGTTSDDRTNYFESFSADDAHLERAIELESERLRNAIISRDELATEMTVVRNEFESGENNPLRVSLQRLLAGAFMWHNYGDSTIGPRSDIERVPNEKLLNWYETYYQPDNAMLVVAGKFDQAKLFKAIATYFGKLPKPARKLPTTYTVEPTQDGENQVTIRRVGGVPYVLAAWHVPAGTDPDAAAVDVSSTILGSAPAGRLYKALVESKKAARVACDTSQSREPGVLYCWAQLGAKDPSQPVKEALTVAVEQLKAPSADELARAKTAQLKTYDQVLNSSEEVGLVLSEFAAMGDWRMLFLHRDRIAAVTADDVTRVAAKYFKASNRTLAEYVPTEKPDRAEVPDLVDLTPVLKDYKGKAAVAEGEAFDASPKNIDARTKRLTLANGAKVALLSKKTRGEIVTLSLLLKFGTEQTLTGQRAAGDFAAKMLLRGTKTKSRQQIKDALDTLKAQVNIGATPQGAVLNLEVRRPQLNETLELLADCLEHPSFDPKEFETLRAEELARAEQAKDDPSAIGQLALRRLLSPYGKGHPLYVPGWPEQIAEATALKVEQARDFHAKFYGAQSALLAVVGDFDEKDLSERLGALFGTWKGSQPYTRIPVAFTPTETKTSTIDTPDKAMAFFGAATNLKLKDADPEYPAMVLADYMLGGGFLSGRVPKRLREKDGLSYGAGTYMRVNPFDDNGGVYGYAIYAPQNVEKVEKGFSEEVTKAVEGGFTAEEFTQAREGLMRSRVASRAEDGRLAPLLATYLELDRPLAFDGQVDEKLTAMSLAEVNAALKKNIDPKKFSIIKVGDFKKVVAPK